MGLKAEVLLDLAAGALRARPPAGVDAAYVEGFLARNRHQLLAIVAAAFPARPAPPMEPGLRRFQAEHRLARLLLGAVDGRHFGADPRLADLLEGINVHAVWEEDHLFPALRAAAPAMAAALDHATAEHGLLRRHLGELTAALREGRPYDGPAVALILHHFGEEEAALLALGPDTVLVPALPSALVDAAAEIEALGEELGVETPAGGRRAAVALPPAEWAEGMRVVTEAGDHARIERMRRWVRAQRAQQDAPSQPRRSPGALEATHDSTHGLILAQPLACVECWAEAHFGVPDLVLAPECRAQFAGGVGELVEGLQEAIHQVKDGPVLVGCDGCVDARVV